jgi:hypothetical protein
LYKSRAYVQITHPAYEGDYEEDDNKSRFGPYASTFASFTDLSSPESLITLYQRIHEAIHIRPSYAGGSSRAPAKLVYLRTEHEAVLGWVGPGFAAHSSSRARLTNLF